MGEVAKECIDDEVEKSNINEEEQDSYETMPVLLPQQPVKKIMKKVLPEDVKISREAKELMLECVTEFIMFITQEANDHCIEEKRCSVTGDDLLYSMEVLGYEEYEKLSRIYLSRYRQDCSLTNPDQSISDVDTRDSDRDANDDGSDDHGDNNDDADCANGTSGFEGGDNVSTKQRRLE